jgi:hypothetical protein
MLLGLTHTEWFLTGFIFLLVFTAGWWGTVGERVGQLLSGKSAAGTDSHKDTPPKVP